MASCSGTEIRTLSGHNGAVSGLAFRPRRAPSASASADRTVKLWENVPVNGAIRSLVA